MTIRKYLGIVQRQNSMGLLYSISQDEADPNNRTMVSQGKKKLSIPMPMERLVECWANWQIRGMYIQDAFPELAPEYREFFITTITPEEWKELFKEESE